MTVFPCNSAASLWQALQTRRYKQPAGSLSGEPIMLMRDHCTAADSPAGYKIRVSCEQNEHIIDPQILERQKKLNQFRDKLRKLAPAVQPI